LAQYGVIHILDLVLKVSAQKIEAHGQAVDIWSTVDVTLLGGFDLVPNEGGRDQLTLHLNVSPGKEPC